MPSDPTASHLGVLSQQGSPRFVNGHQARIAVLGAGAFGTALAGTASAGGCEVTVVAQTQAMIERRDDALKDCTITWQGDPALNLCDFDLILLAVASHALREVGSFVAENLRRNAGGQLPPACILNCAKGIEAETLQLPTQVLRQLLPEPIAIGTLSGPSFAKEVRAGLPTAVVVASTDEPLRKRVLSLLHRALFRVYESTDPVGVEVAGALKNVVAIVAGGCDGLNLGANARAAVVTRGFGEIAQIGVKLGADPLTFLGLAGFGDLFLTTTGELSRNRQFGVRLAHGESKEAIVASTGEVIEGISTAASAWQLSRQFGLDTPIIRAAHGVIHENLSVLEAVLSLITRHHKGEFDWIRNR